ncbi:MAG: YegP family protein [Thermotogota bacterium]|nr:YegP family protein [Thermotogota bacterium]
MYEDKGGEFRFRLNTRNGKNILASEGYKPKASCKSGINRAIKNAPDAPVIEEYRIKTFVKLNNTHLLL